MENRKVKLSIDYGNSETRILLSFTDNENVERYILSRIPNNFVVLDIPVEYLEDYFEDYDPSTTYVIENEDGELICSGKYAVSCSPALITKPTATMRKSKNNTTLWSTHNLFIRALTILSKVLEEDINTLINSITWELTISLPAQEVLRGKKEIQQLLSSFELSAVYPEMKGEMDINSITTVPEGFASLVACACRVNGDDNDERLLSDKTFVIDIGEGTTDLSVSEGIDNFKFDTLYTIATGGSNIKNKLRKVLYERRNLTNTLSDAFYEDLLREKGVFKAVNGNVRDYTKEVASVVKSISKSVCNDIVDYLEGCKIDLSEMDRILIVGGGSISRYDNSIYKIIRSYLQDNYNLDNYLFIEPSKIEGVELYEADDGFTDELPEDQIRLLNVIGGAIYSQT